MDLHVVFCPNKQRYFDPFSFMPLDFKSQFITVLDPSKISALPVCLFLLQYWEKREVARGHVCHVCHARTVVCVCVAEEEGAEGEGKGEREILLI